MARRRSRKRRSGRKKSGWTPAGVVGAVAGLYVFTQLGQENALAGLIAGLLTYFLIHAGIRRLTTSMSTGGTRRWKAPASARRARSSESQVVQVDEVTLAPSEVVPWLLDHWDRVNERLLPTLEAEMTGAPAEANLLYALRVAIPGLRAKKLDTLVGRWRTTRCGAGDSGLDAAQASPNHSRTADFLGDGFSKRLRELAQQDLTKALGTIGQRKSDKARGNAAARALEKYLGAVEVLEESDGVVWAAAREFEGRYRDLLHDYLPESHSDATE